jgi:hypothetical protein
MCGGVKYSGGGCEREGRSSNGGGGEGGGGREGRCDGGGDEREGRFSGGVGEVGGGASVTSGIQGGWRSVPEGHECWSSRGNTGVGYGGSRSVCWGGDGSRSGGEGFGGAGVGCAGLDRAEAGTIFTSFTGTTVQTLTQLRHPILTQRRMRVWMGLSLLALLEQQYQTLAQLQY